MFLIPHHELLMWHVYRQCQAIHARSLAPLQDTPSVKITYSAKVKVQAPLRVVMSAQLQSETKESGVHVYEFKQPVSIPVSWINLVEDGH